MAIVQWFVPVQGLDAYYHQIRELLKRELDFKLEADNIEARPVWKPMHLQPVFAGCEVVGGSVAEQIFAVAGQDLSAMMAAAKFCSESSLIARS